jgi:uncharacterized membrane protein
MATEKELQLAQETLETLCKINNTLIEITKDNLNEKNTRNVEKFKITMCRRICITIIVIFLLFFIFYKTDTIVIDNPKTETTTAVDNKKEEGG